MPPGLRDEWTAIFSDSDACVSPVLTMDECITHPLAVEREIFAHRDGVIEPAPAPKFSRTPGEIRNAPVDPKSDTRATLCAWGVPQGRIDELAAAGVIAPR